MYEILFEWEYSLNNNGDYYPHHLTSIKYIRPNKNALVVFAERMIN